MSTTSNIDTHELISSKENIQPLRYGRDTSILCAALQAENDAELQQELEKQRNEFEIKLRTNVGDDPLKDWCAYIHWIEQSFPRQGREGKLNVVLRKCINKFKDCENYKNDTRFIKLCIKYADIEENTVELLSQMHRHGIGVSCAELYITWADKYAVDNCFKKANAIYERGLQCQAKPLELLKEAHQNFQAFLVRKMINEGEIFQPTVLDSNTTETRQPYNKLQSVSTGRKEVVPNVRIGKNVLGAAGKLQQINKEPKLKSNKIIEVYEDSENSYPQPEPKGKLEKVPSKKTMTKENTIKPGPWTNKQNKHVPFKLESSCPPPFQVHRDEEDVESEKNMKTVPSSVLKSHKVKPSYEDENFDNAPLFHPEPYDPTKVSMYCKEQVYAGGLEFQFEELRAIQYRRKREELLAKRMNALKLAHGSTRSEEIAETPSVFKSKSEQKSNEYTDKRKIATIESRRKSLFSDPFPTHNEHSKTNYVPEQDNLPTTDYSMNQTIHTKEALSEMQQLWFSKPPSPVPLIAKPVKTAAKSILKSSKPCFSLYVDESCLENLKTSENLEKPLDLTLKSESQTENENLNPSGGVRKKTGLGQKIKPPIENCKENVFVPESDQMKKLISESEEDDENKENGVPVDYCGPVGKSVRKVSGILTPAENVEIAPLSDEEVEEEEDGDVQNYSSIIQCNGTEITETWNFTKGFQFPRGESTPNIRKSILKKEEFNDSVFVPELQSDRRLNPIAEAVDKLGEINEKTIILQSSTKEAVPIDGNTFIKNLSVIAESSREYRSSSSGSAGASSLPLRPSRCLSHNVTETKPQGLIDPFNDEFLESLLKKVGFPKDNHWSGYFLFENDCIAPKVGSTLALGAENFEVKKILGEGSYARVYKLHNTRNGESMVGKFQKPAFPWEFYITREVQARIEDKSLVGAPAHHFMNVESAYFFKNSSILLTRPVEFGDLLSVINKMKQARMLCQDLAIYFTCQILKIVETLHSCKIINGDIKPDNFLLRNCNGKLQLQLIDFGRSIDMSLLPEGTTFREVVTTEGFTTIEMRLGRPWTYQIDLYGVANCGHCLLFGEYMKVVEKGGIWNISKFIHRYWAKNEWKNFFVNLINVESCTKLPNLSELRNAFEVVLEDCSEIEYSVNKLKNLLQSK